MSIPKNINVDIVTSARLSWNKISVILDKNPELFDDNDEFFELYRKMVVSLFETQDEE